VSRVGVASDGGRAEASLPDNWRASLGTAAPDAADLSRVRGSGSAFANHGGADQASRTQDDLLSGIGHVTPLASPRLPVVTQRDLDGIIAAETRGRAFVAGRRVDAHRFVPAPVIGRKSSDLANGRACRSRTDIRNAPLT
jgi:hypothetical protein